jgi:group I intron endonuclease
MMGLSHCGVYVITTPDGQMYIGSSVRIKKRWSEHKSRMRNGVHYNSLLQKAADSFGIDGLSCRVLLICSEDNLRVYEQRAIDVIKPALNVLPTSEHYLSEHWKNPSFRKRNTERARVQNIERYSNPEYVEKARKSVSVMHTDKVKAKSAESRRKSIAEKGGAYNRLAAAASATFKRLHADPEFAKKHSERMREEMIERCKDKEFCKRRDEAAAKANKKPIRLLNTGDIFPSKNEAASALGISISLITKQMRGLPTKTGYKWEFISDE